MRLSLSAFKPVDDDHSDEEEAAGGCTRVTFDELRAPLPSPRSSIDPIDDYERMFHQLKLENESTKLENERLQQRVTDLEQPRRLRLDDLAISKKQERRLLRDDTLHTIVDDYVDLSAHPRPMPRVVLNGLTRRASYGTAKALSDMEEQEDEEANIVQRVINVFKEPLRPAHTSYLASEFLARDLIVLARRVRERFETEKRVLQLESPVYIFGDTHGNLEDLHYFSEHLWPLGLSLTAGSLLFLGDYVDRGLSSLEVVSYLFALKCLEPNKVWLLRGNHETRDVNGWKDHYGDGSFLWQCENRFGEQLGMEVWEAVNQAFDCLPLAAVVDGEIFCTHGGIPQRPHGSKEDRLALIESIPRSIQVAPQDPATPAHLQQMAMELLWLDPALSEQESDLVSGYGPNSMRAGATLCFGQEAIQDFLKETGCSLIVRAHEANNSGVAISKNAKVYTVFSTSKDHHQGASASCGCLLVDVSAKVRVLNRSPRYRSKFVHRRDSPSLRGLPLEELQKRAHIGLITNNSFDDDDDDNDDLDETYSCSSS